MSQSNSHSSPLSENLATPSYHPPADKGLAEVLQTICSARHTGQITYKSSSSYGYVFLQQGQVIHAMCGTVEGEEAVYLMLSWRPGSFVLKDDILPHKRTIRSTWEQLLFEGARRADMGGMTPDPTATITTANPLTSTRVKDHQPKLIISWGENAPATVELVQEYTRLGRAEDNELSFPEPSLSSRHCVFILSGPDVTVRDLNSSNGTYVNGDPVSEILLRPGDNIQAGIVEIKFVPGVRRPKLSATSSAPAPTVQRSNPTRTATRADMTLKLPERGEPRAPRASDDKAYVTGSAPISYDQLAPESEPEKKSSAKMLLLVLLFLALAALGAGYFVFFRQH